MMNAILKYMPFYGLKLQNKDSKIPEEMQTFRETIFLPRFFFSFKYPWQLHTTSTILLSDMILNKMGQHNENYHQVTSC